MYLNRGRTNSKWRQMKKKISIQENVKVYSDDKSNVNWLASVHQCGVLRLTGIKPAPDCSSFTRRWANVTCLLLASIRTTRNTFPSRHGFPMKYRSSFTVFFLNPGYWIAQSCRIVKIINMPNKFINEQFPICACQLKYHILSTIEVNDSTVCSL